MTVPWLPAWYETGLPIAEDAAKALMAPLFPTGVTGAVEVVNQLPDEMLDTGWIGRLLFLGRLGGVADVRRDQAVIQIAAITNARTDSLLLNKFVRDVLLCIDDEIEVELEDGTTATIIAAKEITGPEEVPGLEYDERIIPSTFIFTFDNPLETPDYSDHLGH
ncbi:phage tail termination protein [Mycolicibacterium porcinum]|uniref:Phage tail protein n=1 Tax=Mycolicibacterium porcinum TaxID=39693 RepID=A0ABV3VI81_9MYCO